jgi:hypothetical protein
MPDPLDRPPFPKRGNKSDCILFEAIGRTLNAWEEVEISLAHLYAAAVSGDRFDSAANHAYGEPTNFRQRIECLQRVAARRFINHPSQPIEGEFARLMELINGYAARRNDIAHGHTLPVQWLVDPADRPVLLSIAGQVQWCLVPPHFRANKFTARQRPAYALTSWEIRESGLVF